MDVREKITALADLMQEFRLAEARLQTPEATVAFRRRVARPAAPATGEAVELAEEVVATYAPIPEPAAEVPSGTPVTSPMTGIFYGSPSPSSPPFVKEGESVSAGQTIGLIEAMKVFNEIPSPISGTVTKIAAESGQLVQPGDPLIIIG
ncbi:MAG: acetyl-CoA carboxylase biotin carboxyl carrier protein [Fimbriimonas sp.]